MGKKDEYRFTVRFDPDDDRHQRAAQILNSQGRAVLAYNGENIEPAVAGQQQGPQEEGTYGNLQKEAGENLFEEIDDGYEMDQEEIELLKNTNNRFRRK